MGGFNIGIGVGLRYPAPFTAKTTVSPPVKISCFGTGEWKSDGYWMNNDSWKMNPSVASASSRVKKSKTTYETFSFNENPVSNESATKKKKTSTTSKSKKSTTKNYWNF